MTSDKKLKTHFTSVHKHIIIVSQITLITHVLRPTRSCAAVSLRIGRLTLWPVLVLAEPRVMWEGVPPSRPRPRHRRRCYLHSVPAHRWQHYAPARPRWAVRWMGWVHGDPGMARIPVHPARPSHRRNPPDTPQHDTPQPGPRPAAQHEFLTQQHLFICEKSLNSIRGQPEWNWMHTTSQVFYMELLVCRLLSTQKIMYKSWHMNMFN